LAILNKIKDKGLVPNADDRTLTEEYAGLQNRLMRNDPTLESIVISPQAEEYNDISWQILLKENGLNTLGTESIPNIKNRRMHTAFAFYQKSIESYISDDNEKIWELLRKVNSLVLIDINVASVADAGLLFGAINYRGEPLTITDLVKNIVISEVEKKEENVENAGEIWKTIKDYLGEKTQNHERFLRYNYDAFRKEYNNHAVGSGQTSSQEFPLGHKAGKQNVITIYEKIIAIKNESPSAFLEDLSTNAKIFSILIGESTEEYLDLIDDNTRKLLNKLRMTEGLFSVILLMRLLKNKDSFDMNAKLINKILDKLIVFFAKKSITNSPASNTLEDLFMDLIKKIEDKQLKADNIVEIVEQKLEEKSSDMTLVAKALNGDAYLEFRNAVNYLLRQVEENNEPDTNEYSKNLWIEGSKWSIEHILPQDDKLPNGWSKALDEDKEKAGEIQAEVVHKIGNLTLTDYNSNLANSSFESKQNAVVTKEDGTVSNIGFNNGLWLNKTLKDEKAWNKDKIEARQKILIKEMLKALAYSEDEITDAIKIIDEERKIIK
jgi:hypothetical protein